ncbi:hypothetical protein MTR67_034657 [Solanum verrucosum]|uniref:Uncharacterized protein n=1 Tax=Solanum verrucosum TaxID=315347 RepID=A0AAF0U8H6_SOLVR|nr:hypothetical protein MTR67_034657 [Solanum verrucosum]
MKMFSHYIPIKIVYSAEDYAKFYLREIVNGNVDHTILTSRDMLRAYVFDLKGNWNDHLPSIEFAYNNNYHSSIDMVPFEALYGRMCRYTIGLFEVGEISLVGPKSIHEALQKVWLIRERLKTDQSQPNAYVDVRMLDLKFVINYWVYMIISPMKGVVRFLKKGKLSPHYVGPY